jgi:hypothetical protein
MASVIDLASTLRRARRAYELARARRAVLGSLPVLVLVGLTCLFSDSPSWTLSLGLGMFSLGVVLLWRGRELKRAVIPGVAAGSVPLVLVLCAQHFGHLCTGTSCSALCMQACAAGGIVAGLAVASVGSSRRSGPGFWLAASALAILTGAMACSCLGVSGVVGLALGYGGGLVPGLLKRALAPAR